MRMYKDDFVNVIQETFREITGDFLNKRVSSILIDVFAESVKKAMVEGNDISIRGFGTFEIRERKEKRYPNPSKHGELVTKPPTIYPAFKAGKELTRAVKDAQYECKENT